MSLSKPPPQVVQLPQDEAVQSDALIQWWYVVGRATGESGREYGFQVVFFGIGVPEDPLEPDTSKRLWVQMGHHALTQVDAGKFTCAEVFGAGEFPVESCAETLSMDDGGLTLQGDGETYTIHSKGADYTLDLTATNGDPAAIHYDGLARQYVFGGWTWYYSRPFLQLEGTVTLEDGTVDKVKGEGWFDRQWGELVQAVVWGWQWFAIGLQDGTRIMVFVYTGADVEHTAAIMHPDGRYEPVDYRSFRVSVLGSWTSPTSGIEYPQGWEIGVPGFLLTVQATVPDQEMDQKHWLGPRYWEGLCTVEGIRTRTGEAIEGWAYAEILAEFDQSMCNDSPANTLKQRFSDYLE